MTLRMKSACKPLDYDNPEPLIAEIVNEIVEVYPWTVGHVPWIEV